MKSLLLLVLSGLALAGCASNPSWDVAQFPPQPVYQTESQVTVAADETKK